MKVKLINPPSPFLQDERVFPYIGIMSVATSLRETGHDVNVVDLSAIKGWEQIVSQMSDADVYGVTSTSSQYKFAHKIGKMLKGRGTTIIGGTHVNNLSDDDEVNRADLDIFDVVFRGEGEGFLDLEGKIEQDRKIKHLDDIGIADRSFLNINSYHYTLDGKKATTILTQRGCPFTCTFCSGRDNPLYKKSRQHSPKRVVEEMDELNKKFGFEGFMWFDDEININPNRLGEIADRLKGKDYAHRGFVRSDLLLKHPETIDYLKQMGFVEVGMGVESGSDEVLERIGKGTTVEMNRDAIKMIQTAGIRAKAFTMIGLPGETYDDVMTTKDFLLKARPDAFDISMMQPYPGSILYRDAKPSNRHEGFEFEYKGLYFNKPRYSEEVTFHKGTPGTYHSNVRTDGLCPSTLVVLQNKLETELRKELLK